MPAIFLRQELFHQMFAVSDTAMFSKRLLNCSSSGKMIPWLPSQKHGVKNRCEILLFILLKCWMALPENRLFLHQELGWEMAFHWRTSSWRGQMEHPKTAAQKWWGNTIGNPEPFPQESPENDFSVHSCLPPSFLSGSQDGPETCSWWKEVENSCFASVLVVRNELFKEADLEMSRAVPCGSAEDELIGNEDD